MKYLFIASSALVAVAQARVSTSKNLPYTATAMTPYLETKQADYSSRSGSGVTPDYGFSDFPNQNPRNDANCVMQQFATDLNNLLGLSTATRCVEIDDIMAGTQDY